MPGVDLLQSLLGAGPFGLLVIYFIMRENAERKDKRECEKAKAILDQAEIASRLELSKTLTMLCMVIQGRADV